MYLTQMLPILRGWEYRVEDFDSEDGLASPLLVKPGGVVPIGQEAERGWLQSTTVSITTYYGKLVIKSDQHKVRIDTSPYFLAAGGYFAPSVGGFYMPQMARMPITARKTVASAATPEVLGTATLMPAGTTLSIQALPGNLGNVYVSYIQAGALLAANRKTLRPGDAIDMVVQNLDRVWLAVDNALEGVEYVFDGPDVLNTTTSVFTMTFQPSHWIPWSRSSVVQMENPANLPRSVGGLNTQTLFVLSFQTVWVRISNLRDFIESIQEVLGVTGAKPLTEELARTYR